MSRRSRDRAQKAEALRLAEQHGSAEASRRTGVPAATIRSWRQREGAAAPRDRGRPAAPRADLSDVDRLEQLVRVEEGAAIRMLAKAQEAAEAGKATDARNFSVAHGIHVDKAAALGQRLDRAREGRVRLAEGQAKLLADVIRAYFAALGLEAHRGLLRGLLEQVSAGQALSASPAHAAEARRELVETLAIEIRARLPDLEPSWEPGGPLPAPRGDEDTASEPLQRDPMIGPIRRVRTFTERRTRRSQGRSNGTGREVVEPSEVLPPAVEGQEADVECEDERVSAAQETSATRLTAEQVAVIRASDEAQIVLAERYGISQPHVSRIRQGHTWRSV